MIDWLKDVPDTRGDKNKKHPQEEIFVCVILGFLNGKTKLRRIYRWCKRHIDDLRKYMPFTYGVPSVPTISRVLAAVDEEMLSISLANWIGEIINTRGRQIAIDGKGLRAAAVKIRDQKTPYIVNALDVTTKLVIGQLAILEKQNEMTAVPELLSMLEIKESMITIDAIGTTERIMEAIHKSGADFLLQVKGNCPELFEEIKSLFDGLAKEKSEDSEEFKKKNKEKYSEKKGEEKNRERYEYRHYQAYHDPDNLKGIQEQRPYIKSIGLSKQVRIKAVQDKHGTDITPSLKDFLQNGSPKQPKATTSDNIDGDVQKFGLIASQTMNAGEMMKTKRDHWAVENSLHYVLDETFGEDKCTIKKGKNAASALRKMAYNIVRLVQLLNPDRSSLVPDIIDDITDDFQLGARMLFEAVPSFY
ncbi:MAG: ISAs1 family transposase [Lachnospiraceae bacterium]|nr:ISAs1 family transposase [Lachnospiraceae bacterium]